MAKRKKRRRAEVVDLSTPERWQHGDMIREVRAADGGRAGGIVAARDKTPLAIDQLFAYGHFGKCQKASRRRYSAAQWIHELWGRTGLARRLTAAYEKNGDPSVGQSEAELWNEKCYHEAMNAMRPFGGVVSKICCDDVFPWANRALLLVNFRAVADLRTGLDLLAEHRGIT